MTFWLLEEMINFFLKTQKELHFEHVKIKFTKKPQKDKPQSGWRYVQ